MSGTLCNGKSSFSSSLSLYLHLALLFTIVTFSLSDKPHCSGPVRFYEELKCKPNFDNPNDKCASSYDCSHLNARRTDKCYINNNVYNIGQKLKNYDKASPCDHGCICRQGYEANPAQFMCLTVDCFGRPSEPKPGCYTITKKNACCETEEICHKPSEAKVECVVDGETYFEGQKFYPKSDPDKSCTCLKGYKGQNVTPFCKPEICGYELRHAHELHTNCIPVFENSMNPINSCAYQFRCPMNNDTLIRSTNHHTQNMPENKVCKFGEITMHIGDELNQDVLYTPGGVKCVCEVPPVPTCQKLEKIDYSAIVPIYF